MRSFQVFEGYNWHNQNNNSYFGKLDKIEKFIADEKWNQAQHHLNQFNPACASENKLVSLYNLI